jgi:hypothetical protein
VRVLHHKITALVSAMLVLFGGGIARGENLMRKNLKASRPDVPPVYTTRSGSRFVRSIDVIRSKAGRRELSLQLQNQPKDSRSYALKAARLAKTKS